MNRKGYTLLEVSLFLAISGGLTLVALIGLVPRLTNVRFSSGMRGLQENVTKQISSSELGNLKDTNKYTCSQSGTTLSVSAGNSGSSSCVFVGRLAVFDVTSVNYRPIIALRANSGCAFDPYSIESITNCNLARVLDVDTSFQYSNGITMLSDTTSYGFVKSPDNNTVHRFIIDNPADNQFQLAGSISNLSTKDVCYKLSNRSAKLALTTTRQEPTLEFNGVCS